MNVCGSFVIYPNPYKFSFSAAFLREFDGGIGCGEDSGFRPLSRHSSRRRGI